MPAESQPVCRADSISDDAFTCRADLTEITADSGLLFSTPQASPGMYNRRQFRRDIGFGCDGMQIGALAFPLCELEEARDFNCVAVIRKA